MGHSRLISSQAHPEFDVHWTLTDAECANAEGWNLYDCGGVLEIERNDVNDPPYENAPHYEYDEDALEHVRAQAAAGSAFHQRALDIHTKYLSPQ